MILAVNSKKEVNIMTLLERMDEFIIKLESEDGEFLEGLDLEFLKWIQQKDINKIHFNK